MRIRTIEFNNLIHYNSDYKEDLKFFFRYVMNNISNIEKILYDIKADRKQMLYNLIDENIMKYLGEKYILKIEEENKVYFYITFLKNISTQQDNVNIIELCKIKILI